MKAPVLLVAAIATISLAFFGCENESAGSGGLSVSPSFAKLRSGQSVVLSASGGDSYGWSLENSSYGHLSASTGSSVTYTATSEPVTQHVTVYSTLGSSTATFKVTIAQGDDAYAASVKPDGNSSTSFDSSSSSSSSSDSGESYSAGDEIHFTNGVAKAVR